METEITTIDISLNGDIVVSGYVNNKKKFWIINQDSLLFFLELQTKVNDPWAKRRIKTGV